MPTPIADMKSDERIFALFVGDSGSGKTSTLPWFPGKKLDLDIDRRYRGLLGHKNPIPLEDVDVHQFPGKDIQEEIEKWIGDWESRMAARQTYPYQTTMFDGFTSYDQLVCDKAIEVIGGLSGKKSDTGGALTAGNKRFGELDLMGWDAFAYELQAFKNTITNLKYVIPGNVICTAHWTDRYEEGKVVGRDINLRKKIINQVILWFDEVYFFEKKTSNTIAQNGSPKVETKHIVHFRNDLARTTFPLLPDSMDWTGKNFYEILMGGRRGEIKG